MINKKTVTKKEYEVVVDKINKSINNLNDENVDLVWNVVSEMWSNDENHVMDTVIN